MTVSSADSSCVLRQESNLIVDEFFSTVPGKNFDLCIISTRTKTHKPFRTIIYIRLHISSYLFAENKEVIFYCIQTIFFNLVV